MSAAMLCGVAAMLAGPVQAEDQAPRCYKVQNQRGIVEQICESAGFVTIESDPAGDDSPSARAGRAHALKHWEAFGSQESGPILADPSRRADWSGLRVGLGPWGALSHASDRSDVGLLARIGYDVAAQNPSPFVFGLMIEQTGRISTGSRPADSRGDLPRAVTSLDIRVGHAVGARFLPYVVAGLATSSGSPAPLNGGTIGIGLAYEVDQDWTLSVDYRHVGLKTVLPGVGPASLRPTGHIASDGFNAMILYRIM